MNNNKMEIITPFEKDLPSLESTESCDSLD
jgi:hypothetical protein